jgi:hypothetical protein
MSRRTLATAAAASPTFTAPVASAGASPYRYWHGTVSALCRAAAPVGRRVCVVVADARTGHELFSRRPGKLHVLLAPCGHPAWTATVGAALWWTRRRPRVDRTLFVAPAAFVAAVLHRAGWDAVDAPLGQTAIGVISVGLLLGWLAVARREPLEPAVALPMGARLPRAA